MKRNLFALIAFVMLLAIPTAVMAQTTTGTIDATGRGQAEVRGNGNVTISGAGTLYIADLAGDAVINVTGGSQPENVTEQRTSYIRYRGFNGTATVTGSNFVVRLSGENIDLHAEGNGRVVLRGEGEYTTNNGSTGIWTRRGVILRFPTSNTTTRN